MEWNWFDVLVGNRRATNQPIDTASTCNKEKFSKILLKEKKCERERYRERCRERVLTSALSLSLFSFFLSLSLFLSPFFSFFLSYSPTSFLSFFLYTFTFSLSLFSLSSSFFYSLSLYLLFFLNLSLTLSLSTLFLSLFPTSHCRCDSLWGRHSTLALKLTKHALYKSTQSDVIKSTLEVTHQYFSSSD